MFKDNYSPNDYQALINYAIENGYNGICSMCGTALKHCFEYKGNIYGSECITKVTGMAFENWVVRNGVIDVVSTYLRDWELAISHNNNLIAINKSNIEHNIELANNRLFNSQFDDVIEVLKTQSGEFCKSICNGLINGDEKITELPDKALMIISQIYCKSFGRFNSKGYNKAYDIFWSKVEALKQ